MNTRLQEVARRVDALGYTVTMAKDPEDNSTIAVLDWQSVEGLLDKLEARPALTDVEFNRFAQYLYEAIESSPNMVLQMHMTSKAFLVDALKTAMERVK